MNDSKNSTFLLTWLQELNLRFNMTQRIEPFLECDSKNWTFWIRLNELNPFFYVTHRIEPFFMTQRIEPFFWRRLKNTTQRTEPFFPIWLKDFV